VTITAANLIQTAESSSTEAGWASRSSMREQSEVLQFDIKNGDGTAFSFTVDDMNRLETVILGGVSDIHTDGSLKRVLPLSHPIRSGFYASARSALEGSGVPFFAKDGNASNNPNVNKDLNPSLLPVALIYPENRVTVEFTPRLYPLLPNSYINVFANGAWYDDSNNQQIFSYADEWIRFTDVDFHPKDDWISFTLGGQMAFSTGFAKPPQGAQYAQMPRIRMPNSLLKITWYQVPYSYITSPNSYLERYKGRINQNGWWRWRPGKLLYINYNPIRYQQPNPNMGFIKSINPIQGNSDPHDANGNPVPSVGTAKSFLQTCDIELEFILTSRILAPGDQPSPTNKNAVAAGHNLLPWGTDRKFHYAETIGGQAVPLWGSFPAEILFTDPDLDQGGVV